MSESSQSTDEYNADLRRAWIDTRMEKDRAILALSAGGVGLVVTLMTTVGSPTWRLLTVQALAGVSFLVAVVVGIRIFEANSSYLEALINRPDAADSRPLVRLDWMMWLAFLLGLVLSAASAIFVAAGRILEVGQ